MTDNLKFRCALVTGGAGGIGRALSEWLISQKIKVIIAGRTVSKLESTAKEIGAAAYYQLDTGKIDSIESFVQKITKEHPELDCLINNAGVQRPLETHKLDADEFLSKADNEININIRGPIHLALRLLPHFRKQENPVIVNVSSILGFIPFSIINPVYNGTKSFMHSWSLALRTQLQKEGGKINVLEIAPPAVETDLHREREDPDDNKKSKNSVSLSIDEFMSEVEKQWKDGNTTITAGPGVDVVDKWYKAYGEQYEKAAAGYQK